LAARGDIQKARETHERALALRIQSAMETHFLTACSYWKLATLWEDEDWTKAVWVSELSRARKRRRNDMANKLDNRSYDCKALEIYARLHLTGAQTGRVYHHLATLYSKNGVSGFDEYLEQARKIYASLKHEELPEEGDPFRRLIKPFYW